MASVFLDFELPFALGACSPGLRTDVIALATRYNKAKPHSRRRLLGQIHRLYERAAREGLCDQPGALLTWHP